MKKCIASALLVFLFIPSFAIAAIEAHYQENSITIQKAEIFDSENKVKIKIGNKIKFVINIYEKLGFYGDAIIYVNAKFDNTSSHKVKAIFWISFYDKNGKLVGCDQGSWDLNPDEDLNYGSNIFADSKSISTITSYKLKTLVIKSKKLTSDYKL